MSKRILALILVICFVLSAAITVSADDINGGYAYEVTDEMCRPDYWYDKSFLNSDEVLMQLWDVLDLNKKTMENSGQTYVYDLANYPEEYNADKLRLSLSGEAIPTTKYYVDGKQIDNSEYFGNLFSCIKNTGWTDTLRNVTYAICVNNADLKSYPTNDAIGYSSDDCDDEVCISGLLVNEPFVIKQKCIVSGVTYYFGYADNMGGWICADNLAICKTKSEWLDAWNFSIYDNDILVVTQDKVLLDYSLVNPYTSGRLLTMGTVLKSYSKADAPQIVDERISWNNYVVKVPCRDEDGYYFSSDALIAMHNKVHMGYLPFTQKNLIDVAFSCLGNRYGWGNVLGAYDCSGYVRNIYRCFGIKFPRNTTYQQTIPGTCIGMSDMTEAEKEVFLRGLHAGTALFISGHCMMYLGMVDGVGYVIDASGSLCPVEGDIKVVYTYDVIVNSLNVRRGSGLTWTQALQSAVVVGNIRNISDCSLLAYDNGEGGYYIYASYGNTSLEWKTDFDFIVNENDISVIGIGKYTGIKHISKLSFVDIDPSKWYYSGVEFCTSRGYMNGIDKNIFAPDGKITRAEVVQILAKISGCDLSVYADKNTFKDVEKGKWYHKAVEWAYDCNITSGTGEGNFAPTRNVSRQELALLIMSFAKYAKIDIKNLADITTFNDYSNISSYAVDAMSWAVGNKIMSGTGENMLSPKATATRAQCAVIVRAAFLAFYK